MKKRVIMAAALGLVLAGTVLGQVDIIGVLQAGPEPMQIDSVLMRWPSGRLVFPTPDWLADPTMLDTFNFPSVMEWPNLVHLYGMAPGRPVELEIMLPVPDSWYTFPPPDEQALVLFHQVTGIEEERSGVPGLSVVPSMVAAATVLRVTGVRSAAVAIVDAAGNPVWSAQLRAGSSLVWPGTDGAGRPVPDGIYFCRLMSEGGSLVRKVVVVRSQSQ